MLLTADLTGVPVLVLGAPDDARRARRRYEAAGAAVRLEEPCAVCADRLAGHEVPRSMDVVDALPLSPVGKVLKRELRKPCWAGQERAVH